MKGLSIPILLLSLAATAPVAAATPPAVTALINQAQHAQVRGEHELALRMAQAAIVADPSQPASYVALGQIYAQQGQQDYARSYYELALQIDRHDAARHLPTVAPRRPANLAAATP